MLQVDPDSEYYKQLYIRYYAALNLQYTGYKNMLLELVQGYMTVGVVEKIDGVMPYKVTFSNLIPGYSSEAYLFYPEGYLKLQTGIDIYPDDYPTDIKNTISHNSNDYFISNNYLKDGEFLVVYCIDNNWYKFTFEISDNQLIKINDVDVDLNTNNNIWFDKIDSNIKSKLSVYKYSQIHSLINIKRLYEDLSSKISILHKYDIESNIDIHPFNKNDIMPSNINIAHVNSLDANIAVKKYNDYKSKIEVLKHNNIESNISIYKNDNKPSNIIITKIQDINSQLKIKNYSDMNLNIGIMNVKDLQASIFIHYSDVKDLPGRVKALKYENIYSTISSYKVANTVEGKITIQRWNYSDIKHDMFIIGKGRSELESHVLITTYDTVYSNIFILKYTGIRSNLTVKPHDSDSLSCNIFINQMTNLFSNIFVDNEQYIMNAEYTIGEEADLKSNISVNVVSNNNLIGNININNNGILYGNSNITLDKYINDVKSSIIIKSLNNVKQIAGNIIINDNSVLYGNVQMTEKVLFNDITAKIFIPDYNILNSNIVVNAKSYLYADINMNEKYSTSEIISTISIPDYSMLCGNLFIRNKETMPAVIDMQSSFTNDINSNIIITIGTSNDLNGNVEILSNKYMLGNVELFRSLSSVLESTIEVQHGSILKSNVFVQPSRFYNANYIVIGQRSNSLVSNMITTHFSTINASINIEHLGDLFGKNTILAQINNGMQSNVVINAKRFTEINSNIYIQQRDNKMNAEYVVCEVTSLRSNIIVVPKAGITHSVLKSNIFISSIYKNAFDIYADMAPAELNDLRGNVIIPNNNDIASNVTISLLNKVVARLGVSIGIEENLRSNVIVTRTSSLRSNIKILGTNKAVALVDVLRSVDANEYKPLKDSYVTEQYPYENYGLSNNLFVGNTPNGQVKSIIAFNISSIKSQVVHAYLKFKPTNFSNFNNLEVQLEDYLWEELGITWKNHPNSKSDLISTVEETGNKSIITFNVTQQIKYALENGTSKIAFGLYQQDNVIGSTKCFYSRHTNNSPTLKIVYEWDIKEHYDMNQIKSNIVIANNDCNNINSIIDVRRYNDISDLRSEVTVRTPDTIIGNINITRDTNKSNIIIRQSTNNDINSNMIVNTGSSIYLHSTVVINGFTLPCKLNVGYCEQLQSNVIITKNDFAKSNIIISNPNIQSNIIIQKQSENDLDSTILISKSVIESNIIIPNNSELHGSIKVVKLPHDTIRCSIVIGKPQIGSSIIITQTESRRSNIFIRQKLISDLHCDMFIIPRAHNDLPMSLLIRHDDDLRSKIAITRPKIPSNIIIRQFGESDLRSTIKIYVFDGYITII